MNAPLAIPSYPTLTSMVWRVIRSLPVVRRLRELSAARDAATGSDADTDTSLTQAHLEVLK